MSLNHASVGIDLGSSKVVIGVAKKGGVEVLTNDASYRQTPTVVSYGPERICGDKAIQKIKKNIAQSILLPPRFIGELSQEQFRFEKKFNFCKSSQNEHGNAQFNVNYEGEQIKVNTEQVMSGVFTEILSVLKLNKIDQKEAVVSVPAFLNQIERQSIIDAAKVAGLEITKLYNESAANVMNYGIFRMGDLDKTSPRLVGFVDLGHSKTTVFFANIWKDRAEIIFETSDPNLGTRDMDLAMLNHYVDAFDKQHKIDLRESPKSMFRLLEAIEKQRKTLTLNQEAVLAVDCIYEDIDYNHLLTREEFERINQPMMQRLVHLMKNVITELSPELLKSLHSVERIGGGARIPFVEKIIASTFGFETVSKTLDASESVARGCAIQAAMLSPLFKVANYAIAEKLVNPVFVKLQYEGEEEKTKELFKAGSEFGKSLSIVVQRSANLKIALAIHSKANNQERILCHGFLEKITAKEEKFEGKVYFLLDRNGVAMIEKCELRETYVVEEKIPVKKPAQEKPKETPKDSPKPEGDDTKMQIETPDEPKDEFTIEKKEKTRISPLTYQNNLQYGLERSQIEVYKKFEAQVYAKENLFRETQEAKYSLESFIYETRNKINEGKNSHFTTPQEKALVLDDLQKAETWLYDEGQNTVKEQYDSHLLKIKTTASCFTSRFTKMELARNYYTDANTAYREYQPKNAELIQHGSMVQLNELNQKWKEGTDLLAQFDQLFANQTLANIDGFNFEQKKDQINKGYESMNNVLAMIKKDKEQKEADEKKKADEAKKKADEAKKKEEEEKKAKTETANGNNQNNGSANPKDDTKMDIEK